MDTITFFYYIENIFNIFNFPIVIICFELMGTEGQVLCPLLLERDKGPVPVTRREPSPCFRRLPLVQ